MSIPEHNSLPAASALSRPQAGASPVAFFGSDAIALPLLHWLHTSGGAGRPFVLSAVISQPDRKSGRGQKLQPNPISAYALENGIPLLRPEKPDAELTAWLVEQNIQLALVMAYGHLLKKTLLAAVPLGFVNFHASLLPHYRGASPVESAVACGEAFTGVSLMRIVPKMDAGAVLATETVAIDHARAETGADIRQKLAAACVPLIEHNMDALLDSASAGRWIEQEEAQATYCRKLDKSDGQLDFDASAAELAARINGLFPWPGCYLDYRGERFKVAEAYAEPSAPVAKSELAGEGIVPPAAAGIQTNGASTAAADIQTDRIPIAGTDSVQAGTILSTDKSGLRIATGRGVLRVCRLQKAGGKMLAVHEFIAGTPLGIGQQVQGGAMRKLRQLDPVWSCGKRTPKL